MLNEGIRTRQLDLQNWVLDPDAQDTDIVAAMKLPSDLSVETLLIDEMGATDCYQRAWSAISGLDTGELFLRNSTCKRVLYLSAPIFLPDTLPQATLIATGVNSRIHVYDAPDPRDIVRLEAVSTYESAGLRFRYALSIQYARDETGAGWQIIRPVIILDQRLLRAVHDDRGRLLLSRVLAGLRSLVLCGSHDYVHATVLNWFPPPAGLPARYAAVVSERPHPPEVDSWHAGTQLPLPPGLLPGRPTPKIATLELYSLLVHTRTISHLMNADESLLPSVAHTLTVFRAALTEFASAGLRADRLGDLAHGVSEYFHTLAGWFILSAFPLRSPQLRRLQALAPEPSADRVMRDLAGVHGGMFDVAATVPAQRCPWKGEFVDVDDITRQYSCALRAPAISTYASYLAAPRQKGQPSWAEVLTGHDDRTEPWRARLTREGLERLGACGDLGTCREALTRPDAREALTALERAVERPLSANGNDHRGPGQYALALAAGLVALARSEHTGSAFA